MPEATEMTAAEYVNEVKSKLLGLGDKSKILKMSAYLKDQFTFLGIATPLKRDALKSLNDSDFSESQLFEIAEALWFLPEREYRYAAIDLLDQKSKVINTADSMFTKTRSTRTVVGNRRQLIWCNWRCDSPS